MRPFIPLRVYYEEAVVKYEQGKKLIEKYEKLNIPLIPIETITKLMN